LKIPKEIKIKGKTWKIEYKWNLNHGGEVLDGECDPNTRTIYIRRELTKEEKPAIFLHEFLHAVFYEAHLSYNDGWVDTLIEEVMCDSIQSALLDGFTLRPK
jgi:hypothetical protein